MGDKLDTAKVVKDFLEIQSHCIKEIQANSEIIDKFSKILILQEN